MEKDSAKVLEFSSRSGINETYDIPRSIQSSNYVENARANE